MTEPKIEDRQAWMAVLARADRDALERNWQRLPEPPGYTHLRAPECGMAMVRGRVGGDGDAFNLGEVTVTRCAIQLADLTTGMSWVLGRDKRHAELAAVFDALLQTDEFGASIRALVEAHRADWQAGRDKRARQAAATKVDFFTLVRGEDE